jgi:hypothetical protein
VYAKGLKGIRSSLGGNFKSGSFSSSKSFNSYSKSSSSSFKSGSFSKPSTSSSNNSKSSNQYSTGNSSSSSRSYTTKNKQWFFQIPMPWNHASSHYKSNAYGVYPQTVNFISGILKFIVFIFIVLVIIRLIIKYRKR